MKEQHFIIKDILYTNNGKGIERTSKYGKKYDARRGSEIIIDIDALHKGDLCVFQYTTPNPNDGNFLYTTNFMGYKEIGKGISELATVNSIYVLEKVDK